MKQVLENPSDTEVKAGNNSESEPIGDLYAALTGILLDEGADALDFGLGVRLSRSVLRCHTAFGVDTTPPGAIRRSWVMLPSPVVFNISSELFIPRTINDVLGPSNEVASLIASLLRLAVDPQATLVAYSDTPISEYRETEFPNGTLVPAENQTRYLNFHVKSGRDDQAYWIRWVQEHWVATYRLASDNSGLRFAIDALDQIRFVPSSALALVSIISAMEAIFNPATTELKFRVSSLVASYLEPPGDARLELKSFVSKLYDKRSKAAHGKPKHAKEDVAAAANLLARILMKIVENESVPTKQLLENRLFGVDE